MTDTGDRIRRSFAVLLLMLALFAPASGWTTEPLVAGTGDLGIVIERAAGRLQVVDTTRRQVVGAVGELGDLSHASAVFSRDGRYAYVFGRDGGLSKIDLLGRSLVERTIQAGNSIGGAISQDGTLIAVANYDPGGVKVFDADTLAPVAEIPAADAAGSRSKVVGLVDAPHQMFVFALFEAGEIWTVDFADRTAPRVIRYAGIGRQPYDGQIMSSGRYYLAGLFGEDGLALLDLWHPEAGVRRIVDGYGRGQEPLPVYKMPHLEGCAEAAGLAFVPAVGRHELLVIDTRSWQEVGRVTLQGQPVFAVARPDGRQIWVNFAHPLNTVVQVVDVDTLAIVRTLEVGPAVMHLEFTPRGEQVWISVRDADRIDVLDTRTFARLASLPAEKPSGILFSARAHRIGY